jgi:hypothetical protein
MFRISELALPVAQFMSKVLIPMYLIVKYSKQIGYSNQAKTM